MSDRRTRALIVAASIAGGAIGGYYFGFASARSASRGLEAAQDLLVPVEDIRLDRIRRESIRTMLGEVAETQASAYATTKAFPPVQDIVFDREAYVLEAFSTPYCRQRPDGCFMEQTWLAVARHATSPFGEACAVSLNVEPAHVAGIRLKRAGRIRCSWDLATRINRLLW